jgi:hypothetical protein
MSEEQRKKLSEAQKRYISSDPRWADHRRKLAEAQQRPEQRATLSATQLAYMANDPPLAGPSSTNDASRHRDDPNHAVA